MLFIQQFQLKGYLFWVVILGLILLAAFLVWPFMVAIVSAYLLAYVARPLCVQLTPKLNRKFAAAVCVAVAIILVVVPVTFVLMGMLEQAGTAVSRQSISKYVVLIATHPFLHGFRLNSITLQNQINQWITDITASLLVALPNLALGLLITLIGMYYFLCAWESLSTELRKYIPSTNKDRIIQELNENTRAILFGTMGMAIVEFFITYVGLTYLGIESSLIIAVLMFVLAFIPSIGPVMVWVPLAIFYLANQQYDVAIGMIILGIILTIGVEVLLYTKWIGDHTRIHPFVMMIGVFGGINFFGIFGFVFGPLILESALDVIKGAMQK